MGTSTIEDLREYYYVYGVIIWNTYCDLETHIGDRAQEIVAKLDENNQDGLRSASRELHYLEVQTASTFRYAMLPRFLGFLERIVKGLCRIVDSNSYRNLDQRRWFKSHMVFLQHRGVDFSSVRERIDKVNNVSILRNCIVHANGEIDLCNAPTSVRQAIKKVDTAGETTDGFLMLGDQVIPIAQNANSEILRHLFKHFGAPLDWSRWG